MKAMLILSAGLSIIAGAVAVFLCASEWFKLRERRRARTDTRRRLGAVLVNEDEKDGIPAVIAKTPLGALLAKNAMLRRKASYERDLPALLEVIALGMQAGMGFDQAFMLYTERFDTALAHCCEKSLAIWTKGLISRDEGMRELADRVATPSFRHFSSSALRALRFGAPMTELLLDLAQEARKEYRAQRQELVAKAPVKMLLPTGVLILPAMLLLVMGPIMLDLMRKMG
jgi:tight adherence protein C